MSKYLSKKLIIRILQLSALTFFFSTVFLVILLRFVPVNSSSYMMQNNISNLFSGNFKSVRQSWISLENISSSMQLAVIAAEDQKFADHFGFDVESIEKALRENSRRKRIRGASTITQQVARNLFLWSGKSYIRKGLEAYFTVLLEIFWSKERILEVYLNIAEFGNNIYGVQSAARLFFRKPASRLTKNEASLLAAVLPNPIRFKAYAPSAYIVRRSAWIRSQMDQLGGNEYLKRL